MAKGKARYKIIRPQGTKFPKWSIWDNVEHKKVGEADTDRQIQSQLRKLKK